MHRIQSQLFADHHNFLRLLRCLEVEIQCYESNRPWSAKFPVILDILDYVQFYPEQYHHPMEDALFDLLLAKQVEHSGAIREMKAEHKVLEQLTRKARDLFNGVAHDSVVPMAELVRVCREFIRRQVDHIERENHVLYPLLAAHVSQEEWDSVEAALGKRRDPLFSQAVIDEYRNLYSAILEAESGIAVGATARAIDRPAPAPG